MGHEAEDIPAVAADAGDVLERTVRVGLRRDIPRGITIADQDLVVGIELLQGLRIGKVVPLAMGDRDVQNLSLMEHGGEGSVRVLDTQVKALAAEEKSVVAHQRAGQKPRFAENLEAIADAEHQDAGISRKTDSPHDRREPGDRSAAEVIAIGEAARENHGIISGKGSFLMPDDLCMDAGESL